jgi:ABC-type nitrate/sulfonate/bicarbonate transport system substrate-binding protein
MLKKTMAGAALGALMLVAAPNARAAEKVTVTLGAVSDPVYSPYFIALAKGYYQQQNIELEITHASGGVAIPALISGSVQFSTSSGSAISAIVRGAALRVVMTLSESVPWKLWATNPDIKTLADLKGKQVGVAARGDLLEVSVRAALLKNHIDPNSVSYTALGFGANLRMAMLRTAAIPAVVVDNILGDVAIKNHQTGNSHMLYDLTKEIKTPYLGLATSTKLMTEDPALVKRFLRATYEGLLYMKAFPDGTAKIDKARDSSIPDDTLKQDIDEVIANTLDSGEASIEAQKGEIAVRRQLLSMPAEGAQPPSAVFDYALIRQVRSEIKAQGWKPTE